MRADADISDAERLPPRSEARAAFICSRAAQAVGLVTTGFHGMGGGGARPPGWDDYLAGRLGDGELYRMAEEEARRLAEHIERRLGGR